MEQQGRKLPELEGSHAIGIDGNAEVNLLDLRDEMFKGVHNPALKAKMDEWDIKFVPDKELRNRAVADCCYGRKQIRLKQEWHFNRPGEIADSLAHEMAHAVTFIQLGNHNHNNQFFKGWHEKFKRICPDCGVVARRININGDID
jgi:hypothetical protein